MVEAARRGDLDVLWSSGGNFLDVLPAPDITRTALGAHAAARPPGHRAHAPDARRPGRDGRAAARRDALRASGRRHVDHDRAAGRVQPRDRRARASARRAASARSSSTSRAASTRTAPARSAARPPQAIREEIARVVPAYAGIETLRDDRRRDPGRRRAAVRRRRVPDRRRPRPLQRRRAARPSTCRAGRVPALDPARQAVQLDGVEGRRPAHRRARATRCSCPRPTRPRSASRTGDALLVRSPHGEMRARAHLAPIRPRQRAGVLPRGERAARAEPARSDLRRARLQRGRRSGPARVTPDDAPGAVRRRRRGGARRGRRASTAPTSRDRTERPGQYALDLVADDAACAVLERAPVRIVSEESGVHERAGAAITVVIDPVDGSTNCSRGIAYWATSIARARRRRLAVLARREPGRRRRARPRCAAAARSATASASARRPSRASRTR